jgi:hypothetical protein
MQWDTCKNEAGWLSLDKDPVVVDNSIKSRHTANTVLKQAGLPKKF